MDLRIWGAPPKPILGCCPSLPCFRAEVLGCLQSLMRFWGPHSLMDLECPPTIPAGFGVPSPDGFWGPPIPDEFLGCLQSLTGLGSPQQSLVRFWGLLPIPDGFGVPALMGFGVSPITDEVLGSQQSVMVLGSPIPDEVSGSPQQSLMDLGTPMPDEVSGSPALMMFWGPPTIPDSFGVPQSLMRFWGVSIPAGFWGPQP